MAAAATRADRWGHPVRTTSDACVSAIDAYYHQILSYGRDRKVILEAARRDPDCVLANALAAHFVFSKKPPAATSYLAAAASRLEDATSYEKAVYRAVSCLLSEDRDDDVVINVHRELLKEFPKDLISLKRAQVLCFYIGRPDLSINLVEQVLSHNQQEAYIYGMLAFPLLELGRMCDAEKYALKGFEINKDDFWSQHALCHVLQNDCRFKEAVEFMEACSSSWATCLSFMYTHNWWHVAVCYLEGHSPLEKVLEIYDCYIWKELERDDADCEEVYLNALGLLLRFAVRGQMDYTGDRLKTVVAVFRNESNWHMECLIDLLAIWALASTKEINKAEDLLNSMKFRINSVGKKKLHAVQRGILLAEALLEYGKASHHKVFDILGPNFDAIDYKMIGASDEQLDVFNEVWYIVLLNTGHTYEAIEAIEKRVKQREGVPFLWHLLERAYSMEGRPDASFASTKAKALEVAYFK
uniref:Tetratricopeptide repeat protein 38 n=1 Tax=Anthurium amnicola TaxID=1678845 RepID=A0A1D1XF69_9ARAE